MQTHRSFQLEKYNADWPNQFTHLVDVLQPIFGDNAIRIEHFGSTAIPSISAKPQIDIMIEVVSLIDVKQVYDAMTNAGFTPKGDYGGALQGEEYFTQDNSSGERLASVHVYESGNPKIARNLIFRDYLRTHPEEATRYEAIKRELFEKYKDDYPAYNRGKNEIITEITAKATNPA